MERRRARINLFERRVDLVLWRVWIFPSFNLHSCVHLALPHGGAYFRGREGARIKTEPNILATYSSEDNCKQQKSIRTSNIFWGVNLGKTKKYSWWKDIHFSFAKRPRGLLAFALPSPPCRKHIVPFIFHQISSAATLSEWLTLYTSKPGDYLGGSMENITLSNWHLLWI